MWNDLNNIWQEAFKLAWESYKRETIPIGAVITDEEGNIISKGRNRIFDSTSSNPLAGRNMAHAEMTALLNLKENEHPNIRKYTLYTTMEPCPMCFGAMVMGAIRNVKYAAKDGIAGAAELNDKMEYIKGKRIQISREGGELEVFQLCLQSAFEFKRRHPRMEELLDSWRTYCNNAILLGKQLHEAGFFEDCIKVGKNIDVIYDEVIERYKLL